MKLFLSTAYSGYGELNAFFLNLPAFLILTGTSVTCFKIFYQKCSVAYINTRSYKQMSVFKSSTDSSNAQRSLVLQPPATLQTLFFFRSTSVIENLRRKKKMRVFVI